MRLNRAALVIAGIFVVALSLRLPYAGEVMAADDRNWMLRSQSFWHELFRRGDISGTFLSSHPGATVMWLAGAGITWQTERLGFDLSKKNTIHFRRYATAPIAIAAATLIALATYLLWRLLGLHVALLGGVFLAIDPYLIGMNQTIHPDALLGLFMLAALLSSLLWVQKMKWRWLIFAGIMAGLAFVTKLLPALWLVPIVGLILLGSNWKRPRAWLKVLGQGALIALLAAITFAIVWPATLAQPDFQLGYLSRDATAVAAQEHVALDASPEAINPVTFYARTWLGRLNPVTQVLVIGTIVSLLITWWRTKRSTTPRSIRWLLVFAFSYLVFITFAAKKADRYALPALIAFLPVAGWALSVIAEKARQRFDANGRTALLLTGVVIVAVLILPLSLGKHALTYNNFLFPSVRPPSQQGWGEGLESAAQWINDQPGVDKDTVVSSWYSSVFGTYFAGTTVKLESRFSLEPQYIVTYRNMEGRAPDTTASEVIFELIGDEPLHTVTIKGEPYAWIWDGSAVQP